MRHVTFAIGMAALALTLLIPQVAQGQDPICSLPADVGPCDGACPRWYHDSGTGQCEEFLWGCCEGNENNFETQAECEAACPPDICSLPADPGPCRGSCPRWYHDSETGRCEEFIWGCCEGNENNFETQAECEAACPPDICSLPPDVGPCDGICPRWYHDTEAGRCEEFIWGCCGGNENNFETQAECEAACPPDICSLPPDVGPCEGVCPRWYHDSETGRCEEFIWGCCDGNENNFETQAECEAACPPGCPLPGEPSHLLVAKDGIDLILTWDDALDALGWNVHRDGWRDPSTWGAAHAAGVTDADPVLDGVQYRDSAAVLGDPLFYYLITALNACGESPLR